MPDQRGTGLYAPLCSLDRVGSDLCRFESARGPHAPPAPSPSSPAVATIQNHTRPSGLARPPAQRGHELEATTSPCSKTRSGQPLGACSRQRAAADASSLTPLLSSALGKAEFFGPSQSWARRVFSGVRCAFPRHFVHSPKFKKKKSLIFPPPSLLLPFRPAALSGSVVEVDGRYHADSGRG